MRLGHNHQKRPLSTRDTGRALNKSATECGMGWKVGGDQSARSGARSARTVVEALTAKPVARSATQNCLKRCASPISCRFTRSTPHKRPGLGSRGAE
jgi:hypothetical protein